MGEIQFSTQIYTDFSKKLEKNLIDSVTNLGIIIGFFSILPITMVCISIILPLIIKVGYIHFEGLFVLFIIICMSWLGIFLTYFIVCWLWIYLFIQPLSTLIKNIKENIIHLHESIYSDIEKTQDIDEILSKVSKIFLLQKRLLWIFNILKTINSRSLSMYSKIIKESSKWILYILSDLSSDLSIKITQQQTLVKKAKSDVEKNLSWTPELLQVSEAQKIRLDRQTEQFENLQKSLINH